MSLPTIPIDARVAVNTPFKENPATVKLKDGQIKTYGKRNFRQLQVTSGSYSAFVYNIQEVDTFLLSLQGYLPFILPQTGKAYVCTDYTLNFKDNVRQGTVNMTLIAVTNFIQDMTDLTNYYTKAETSTVLSSALSNYYTKAETLSLIGSSGGGTTDLSNYYNKSQTDNLLSNKANTSALSNYVTTATLTSSYYPKTDIDTLLGNKVDSTTLTNNYYNKSAIDTALGNKANTSILADYVTSSNLSTTLGTYYNKTDINTLLGNKADSSSLVNYYTKTQADTLLGNKADSSVLANYYTKTQDDTLLGNKADVSALASYYTKTQADTLLLAKTTQTQHQQDIDTKVNKGDTFGKELHYADMLWTPITYTSGSGWSDFSTSSDVWDIGKYTVTQQGELIIQGLAKKSSNGTNGEVITTLPVACRPLKNKFNAQFQWTGSVGKLATTLLNTSGQLTWGGATGDAVSYTTLNQAIIIENRTVGIIGDSITAGSTVTTQANRYSSLYATAIGYTEVNAGISGTVLQNTDAVTDNMQDRFLAQILRQYVKLIVINGGLNDLRSSNTNFTVAKYQASLTAMVTMALQYYSGEQIIICSPPRMNPSFFGSYSGFTAGSVLKQQQYRDAVKAVALAKKVKYVDVYQAMVDNGGDQLIVQDGIHPGDGSGGTNSQLNGHLVIKTALMTAAIPYA